MCSTGAADPTGVARQRLVDPHHPSGWQGNAPFRWDVVVTGRCPRGLNQGHQRATEAHGLNCESLKCLLDSLVRSVLGTRNEQVVGSIPTGGSQVRGLIGRDQSRRDMPYDTCQGYPWRHVELRRKATRGDGHPPR
jgi:hypothetical protein